MQEDSKLIKLKNYEKIYALFFEDQSFSKPQIAERLQLSMPTVMANITRLEKNGLIFKCELFESSGGRPATGYALVNDAKVAIGVEITKNTIHCAVIDLKGSICTQEFYKIPCSDSSKYFDKLCETINTFISLQKYSSEQILGIGISIQAIVDNASSEIIYSKIIPIKSLNSEELSKRLKYPVNIYHDVECAATAELWFEENISNAIYVSIGQHLGGALIQNHHIEHGLKGYAGALEHLEVEENGKRCYCGRNGCLETYCSVSALLDGKYDIDEFFTKLRVASPESEEAQKWDFYLRKLAKGLYTVYLLLERDFILGGLIAPYLTQADIKKVESIIINRGSFNIEPGFIRIAKLQNNSVVIGSALNYIGSALPKGLVKVVR